MPMFPSWGRPERLRGLNLELERLNLESLVVLLLACPSQSLLLRGYER